MESITYQSALLFTLLNGLIVPEDFIVDVDALLELMQLEIEIGVFLFGLPQSDGLLQVIHLFFLKRLIALLREAKERGTLASEFAAFASGATAIELIVQCNDIVLIRDIIIASLEDK